MVAYESSSTKDSRAHKEQKAARVFSPRFLMPHQPTTSPVATRPHMPKDYGILQATAGSGLMSWSHASERLAASHNYWVHTTRPDGRPHVKPVWGLWFAERFYFSTSPRSVNGRNIVAHSSLAVHLESGDDVVILEGKAEVVTDPNLLSQLDEAYFAKYSYHLIGDRASPVYALRHEVAFTWMERDFAGSATRYDFQI